MTTDKKLTAADTRKVWQDICDKKKIRILVASDIVGSDAYNVALGLLAAFGIEDVREALTTRHVSIPGAIICPKKIGGRSHLERVWSLGVLDHELTHHEQAGDVGGWHRWLCDYGKNKGNRCIYEGQAYGGDADMMTFFGFNPPSSRDIFDAEFRKIYRVSNTQMAEGRRAYERQLAKLKRGRPSTSSASLISAYLMALGYRKV